MVKTYLMPIICLALLAGCQEALTPESVLKKSIEYHDPDGRWGGYRGWFAVNFVKDDSLRRVTEIEMDIARGHFKYTQPGIEAGVNMDSCYVISGDRTCDQIKRTRNYYMYLWGLPMKLMDPGTVLESTLQEEVFNEYPCYVIQVRYEKDVWFFYIDKQNYALRGYMFYQDEANKQGEVIYLEGEELLNGMRIPKNRTWYTTPENEMLGMDVLVVE